jgi:hypothetical protein
MTARVCLQLTSVAFVLVPVALLAQAEVRPAREFTSFRGTWTIDESAGRGHIGGLPIARTLRIATSAEELRLTKDGGDTEIYRLDGSELETYGTARSVVLVADTLAVSTRRTRRQRGYAFTNVITDAYAVSGDVLTVERQLSVVVAPLTLREGRVTDEAGAGHLAELENPTNNRQTIVYRRSH